MNNFEGINTIEELLQKIQGLHKFAEIGATTTFLTRLEFLKEKINTSHFSIEEFIKIQKYFSEIVDLHKFDGLHYLVTALEFEQYKNLIK